MNAKSPDLPDAAKPAWRPFDAAEMGAIAHLYRGEVYRSTIWRTRLDNTTNWAIVTMGFALSTTFASKDSSPLPLLVVGLLLSVFLVFEARRYRYFNVWRARTRWMETHFYAPMLRREAHEPTDTWSQVLANDYRHPRYHISLARAVGRRLRRNYIWMIGLQAVAYYGKIATHPVPIDTWSEFVTRASVGPVRGEITLIAGLLYNGGWVAFALITLWLDERQHRGRARVAMG